MVKNHIIVLKWFQGDENNVKQFFFDSNNLYLGKLPRFSPMFSLYTHKNRGSIGFSDVFKDTELDNSHEMLATVNNKRNFV